MLNKYWLLLSSPLVSCGNCLMHGKEAERNMRYETLLSFLPFFHLLYIYISFGHHFKYYFKTVRYIPYP